MLLVLRDPQDRLEACLDYYLVDEKGQLTPQGPWVFVNQLELNPGTSGVKIIRKVIFAIQQLHPTANFGYWERRDKPKHNLRTYTRRQLVRRDDYAVA